MKRSPRSSHEGYHALLAPWAGRVYDEDALMDAYLGGEAPDLAAPTDVTAVGACKWLSYVAAADEAALPSGGSLGGPGDGPSGTWPHAAGHLALNPLYDDARGGPRFRFPSPWYASENARMAAYHAPAAELGAGARADLAAGRRTPALDALAAQFVVIGLPAAYARRRRPWPMHAHRTLTHTLSRLRPPAA